MSNIDSNDILEQVCEIDIQIDENEVEELETISDKLYELVQSHPERFNDWEFNFIIDTWYPDKAGLTQKQKDSLYRLYRKFTER